MKKSKSSKRKRTTVIQARVTPEEKQTFLKRCDSAELTPADYIRAKCLDAKPLRAMPKITVERELILQAIHQLMRYGNNLNQVARKLNQGRTLNKQELTDLKAAIHIISELRLTFRQALGYDS